MFFQFKINELKSSLVMNYLGVPQGSVMGPKLRFKPYLALKFIMTYTGRTIFSPIQRY